jgi:hypothetical protein
MYFFTFSYAFVGIAMEGRQKIGLQGENEKGFLNSKEKDIFLVLL